MKKLTIKQYRDAIMNNLSSKQIETLQTLYYFPNSSATTKELANALGYLGFQAANREIGKIGKAISLYSKTIPPEYESGRGWNPAYYLLIGEYKRPAGWVMWNNLRKALESLKLVTSDHDNSETYDRLSTEIFEFDENKLIKEGKVVQVYTNRYERSQKARLSCIKHYGKKCMVCNFDFGETYGDLAEGFIHVHHLLSLFEIKKEYIVDPIKDLIPICANCHSVIHLTKPALSIEDLKKRMKKKK